MLVEHLENPKQLSNPIVFEDAANLAFSIHLMEMSQMTTEGLVGALCQERAVRRPFSQIARRIPENKGRREAVGSALLLWDCSGIPVQRSHEWNLMEGIQEFLLESYLK